MDPILQFIRVTLVGLSLLFIACVATGRSAYPRWLALFSPGVLLGVVFLGDVLVPAVGGYFLPAAMNVAHTVFFTLCAATVRRDRLP